MTGRDVEGSLTSEGPSDGEHHMIPVVSVIVMDICTVVKATNTTDA